MCGRFRPTCSFAPFGACASFRIHRWLGPWAVILRSCGVGFTFSGGLRWDDADCDLGDALCCGAGCGVLKSCGGTAAGGDVTLAVVVAAGVGPLAALAGQPMAAVPTGACAAALRAWASRARTRVPSAWYSQTCWSWGSTGLYGIADT